MKYAALFPPFDDTQLITGLLEKQVSRWSIRMKKRTCEDVLSVNSGNVKKKCEQF